MKDFKKGGFRKGGGDFGGRPKFGNKFGGERKFSGGSKFGGRGGGRPFGERPEMHSATCSDCGKTCEVPFRPTGERPIFCRDCFAKKEQAPWRGDSRGGDRPQREFPQREFRPRFERHDHAGPREGGGNVGNMDELKRQIIGLESKVNRILEILSKEKHASTSPVSTEVSKKEKAIEVLKAPRIKKVKKEKK